MPTLPANKEERAEIDEVLATAKLDSPVARARALKAFAEETFGEVSRFESWLAVDLVENPAAWGRSTVNADDADLAALKVEAFVGRGSADARGRLVKLIGETATDISARKEFGLRGLGDFARPGVAVVADDDKTGDDKEDKAKSDAKARAKNPWLDDSPGGESRRISFIKSCGSKASESMARSANRTLSGKPLKGAA